ncbi:Nn.00g034940.m01.CDS01 [Neocucurbitaria sp. VM-36]
MVLTDQIVELNNIAGFMTYDSDLWITSRYERLHLINVLAIQQRMSALEQDIDDIVKYERCIRDDVPCAPPEKSSEKVLFELQETIKAYGILIDTSI